jgi:hypothetical protein
MLICALLFSIVFYLCFYWTVGFVSDSVISFYTWLVIMIFCMFAITLGQAIASVTPSTQVAALLNPFIFSTLNLFCGVSKYLSDIAMTNIHSIHAILTFILFCFFQ